MLLLFKSIEVQINHVIETVKLYQFPFLSKAVVYITHQQIQFQSRISMPGIDMPAQNEAISISSQI